jgi:hypothetical protein
MNRERTSYRLRYSDKLLARVTEQLRAIRNNHEDSADKRTVAPGIDIPSHLGSESLLRTVEIAEVSVLRREEAEAQNPAPRGVQRVAA